jgi:hypothetical protein
MTKAPNYLLKHGGAGLSKKLADTAFWLPDVPDEYIELLDAIDRTKDPRLLLPYLKVPAAVRPHLKDLFDRLEFKTRKGRRADAKKSYRPSDDLIRLKMARDQVRSRRNRGMPREEAISKAIQQWRVDRDVLESALANKHTALRKAFPN